MLFEILKKESGEEWTAIENIQFDCPREAKIHATNWAKKSGVPHKISAIKIDDVSWHKRERDRFAGGEYSYPKNWPGYFRRLLATVPNHYAHLSKKNPYKIAYTENADKGIRDIQTTMNTGRYLERYHADVLSSRDIAELSSLCGDVGLNILHDTDAIVQAYLSGPNSCMSKTIDYYDVSTHPVAIYGGDSNLSLAVLVRPAGISSRVLVWQDKKIFGHIYGDEAAMELALSELDYHHSCDFVGARLNKIEERNDIIVCAYLDGCASVDVLNDHLIITYDGEHLAENVDGTLGGGGFYCEFCETPGHGAHNTFYVESFGYSICESCYCNSFSTCSCCEVVTHDDNSYSVHGETICQSCFEDDYFTCKHCGDNEKNDEATYTDDAGYVCPTCFEENYFLCVECNEPKNNQELSETDNTCDDCHTELKNVAENYESEAA